MSPPLVSSGGSHRAITHGKHSVPFVGGGLSESSRAKDIIRGYVWVGILFFSNASNTTLENSLPPPPPPQFCCPLTSRSTDFIIDVFSKIVVLIFFLRFLIFIIFSFLPGAVVNTLPAPHLRPLRGRCKQPRHDRRRPFPPAIKPPSLRRHPQRLIHHRLHRNVQGMRAHKRLRSARHQKEQ